MTQFKGCTQLYQYFVKADGTMACSCMRYWDILADLRNIDAGRFYNGQMMKYIRQSFAEGYEPFSFCHGCASRLANYDRTNEVYDFIDLHIEPNNQCNLYCEACICTFERLSSNVPARVALDYEPLREIVEGDQIGRPFRPPSCAGRLWRTAVQRPHPRYGSAWKADLPNAFIFVDTNANFGKRRAEEIANCGLNEIRLALDGVDQSSYEAYRRNGEYDKALQFTKDLAAEIRRDRQFDPRPVEIHSVQPQ